MKWYTHIIGAIVFFLLFACLTGLNQWLIGLVFAGWISVLPDLLDMFAPKHKSFGHSIFLVLPCLIVCLFNVTIGIALIIGLMSHTILDILTTNGTPALTPLTKTNFAILYRKRRIRTGTNQDKALFITLVFLLIPILFFNIGTLQINGTSVNSFLGFHSLVTGKMNETDKNVEKINENLNINLKISQDMNGIIKLEHVSDNETSILIKSNDSPG
ncbi:MAG: metal-dependent hydrolase [Methanobacterium sp. ERen5]|nr:MAG: metal-dependent hydrolase [Methanobacterium sp. ERen5]